jgi:4-diphosphocytidyl-2-C-methyl-D-erythritol kinase
MRKIRIPAYAKVNLRLEVLGKRADGYHELRTIFQTVGLHDT